MIVVILSAFKFCNFKLCGKLIIDYVKQAAADACFESVTVNSLSDFEPLDTQHYIIVAGDMPLITRKSLLFLADFYKSAKGQPCFIGDRDDALLTATPGSYIGSLTGQDVKPPDYNELVRVSNYVLYADVLSSMRARINNRHMENGVLITDPLRTDIDHDVIIEPDTVIYPNCLLEGSTKIGRNCCIGPATRLVSSHVGDGSEIMYSVVSDSRIGSATHIGPYSYIRPGSIIGDDCKIGDFVEIKNSAIGNHTKISHLTYVGDADVGQFVNFGCGTVTVNYDGRSKHRTQIGNGAFIGCNTNLVAPVSLGENTFTAAGSTITKDVPDNSLAIARSNQVIKPDWVLKRK